MKTHHRILKPLAMVLALILLFGLMPAAHAADHLVGTPGELATALSAAADGDTIRLTANIVYNNTISIEDKTITLDVQNFDLTVNSTSSSGLYVENGGVALVGTGAFDVSGYGYGVTADAGGIGAEASVGGEIIVGTSITADVYARVNAVNKSISDRTVPTTKLCFATYSDGADSVWVLAPNADFSADPETLPSEGGDSVITITGVDLPGGITITAFDEGAPTAITGTTTGGGTEQAVTLTFPANASTTADYTYEIRVSADGGETWDQGSSATVVVQRASGSGGVIIGPTPRPTSPGIGITPTPTPPPALDIPQTGGSGGLPLWMGIAGLILLAACGALPALGRKAKKG